MTERTEWQSISGLSKFIETGKFRYAAQLIHSTAADSRPGRWFEWLLRPDLGGAVSTAEFIEAVDSLELSLDLDLRSSADALRWLGRQPIDTRLSINVSGQALSNRLFSHRMETLMEQHNILPEQLCFDLTVHSAIGNLSGATRFVKRMRAMGCKIALDNGLPGNPVLALFGPLNLVDYLKIDRNWIATAPGSPSHRQTLESIVDYAKRLRLETIAEGIDHPDQLELSRELGVEYYQGYIDGRPQIIVDSDETGTYSVGLSQSA